MLTVSGRALVGRLYVMELRGRDPEDPVVADTYNHVRRDILGIYHEHEIDALHDAGLEPVEQLPPDELEFVMSPGRTGGPTNNRGVTHWARIETTARAKLRYEALWQDAPETLFDDGDLYDYA